MGIKRFVVLVVLVVVFFGGCASQRVKEAAAMLDQALTVASHNASAVESGIGMIQIPAEGETVTAEDVSQVKGITSEVQAQMKSHVIKPIRDAKLLVRPLQTELGSPKRAVMYNAATDGAAQLAAQAKRDAELKKWIQSKFDGIARKFLPNSVEKWLPKPQPPPDKSTADLIQMVLAALIGSGVMYGGSKAGVKVLSRKK